MCWEFGIGFCVVMLFSIKFVVGKISAKITFKLELHLTGCRCAHETTDDEGTASERQIVCVRKQNFNIFAVYIGLPILNLLYKLLNNVAKFWTFTELCTSLKFKTPPMNIFHSF